MKIQWLKYYIKNAMKNNENLNITFTQISQKNYQVTISVENQTLAEIFHKKIKNKTRYRYQDPLERLIRRRGSCDKKEILSLLFKNKLKEHSIVQIINDIELLTIHNIDPEKQRQSISCTCRYGHSD